MADILSEAGLDAITRWYRKETGLDPDSRAASRLLKISGYLRSTGRSLDEVRLIPNQDRAWNTRRNRSEAEKQAVCIGNTGQATRLTYWWIMPKEPKPKRRKKKVGNVIGD